MEQLGQEQIAKIAQRRRDLVADAEGPMDTASVGLLEEDQLDTVIVINVMEYAQDAFQFLETVHRSLKRGGLLGHGHRDERDGVCSRRLPVLRDCPP